MLIVVMKNYVGPLVLQSYYHTKSFFFKQSMRILTTNNFQLYRIMYAQQRHKYYHLLRQNREESCNEEILEPHIDRVLNQPHYPITLIQLTNRMNLSLLAYLENNRTVTKNDDVYVSEQKQPDKTNVYCLYVLGARRPYSRTHLPSRWIHREPSPPTNRHVLPRIR